MSVKFDTCVDFVFDVEGYESDVAGDAGGYTKYGISQKYHPNIDVQNLTKEQAKEIYRYEYWDACGCEKFPIQIALCVFDAAVQHGQAKALSWRYICVGDPYFYNAMRMKHYADICNQNKSQLKFLLGWINRLVKLNARLFVLEEYVP